MIIIVTFQATYNVWTDKEDWLDNIEGVQEILATCIDAVTENIFYIIRDGYTALAEVRDMSDITGNNAQDGSVICEKVKEGLQTIEKLGLSYKLTSENQILLHEKNIYLQNPLLLKRTQGKTLNIGIGSSLFFYKEIEFNFLQCKVLKFL